MPLSGRRLAWSARLLTLVGVFALALGAVAFAPSGDPAASWWPAAGASVALLVLTPRSTWPLLLGGVALVVATAHLVAGRDTVLAGSLGLADAAGALVAATVLRRRRDHAPPLIGQEDLVRVLLAAVAGGAVAATTAAGSTALLDGATFAVTWRAVATSHAASVIVVVVVPVALAATSGAWTLTRRWEVLGHLAALVLVTALVFSPGQTLPVAFVPLLVLAWGALRFDVRTVAWELLGFSALHTFLTARGYGPFAASLTSGAADALAARELSQGYLLAAAVVSLPLVVAVQQGRRLLERVSADERLFRRNFTESLVGMLFLHAEERGPDLRLTLADLNATATAILGRPRTAILGRRLAELVELPPDFPGVVRAMLAGQTDGWEHETSLVGPRPGRVILALSLLSREGGEAVLSAQLLDVTAEAQGRRQLETAERLTSATLDTTPCIILVTDLDGTIVRVNAATTRITGYAEDELLGRSVWDTSLAPGDAGDLATTPADPHRPPVPVVRESDVLTRDGDKVRVVWSSNVVRDDAGAAAYTVLTGIDVTSERTTAGLVHHLMQASFSTALIGVGSDGLVTVFNSGARHLTGYREEEVVGRPFTALLDPEQLLERTGAPDAREAFLVLLEDLGEDGESEARDWTWVSRSGLRHVVSMTLSTAQDDLTARGGILVVGRDVTEQREAQELLVAALEKERTAVERLQGLDEAKNEFVSTVSHELRTPVTSILGYAELLQDGTPVAPLPDQLPLLDTITRNSQRLVAVCNDLLLLSGLDAGIVSWVRAEVDLAASLEAVGESLRPLLTGRDLDLSITAPEAVHVTGDRAQLERVVINLVSNALKFTEDGGSVTCHVRAEGDEAVLVVRDTGIGIPVEEQAGLFEKFFRASSAQDRAIQGTGLGLSIVAAIVTAHAGRVEVDSAHLAGSTFTVRLPLAPR